MAWGKSLREAQTAYNRVLISEGGNNISNQYSSLETVKGVVSRIGSYKEGYFIIKLDKLETVFIVSVDQYPVVALTEKGDLIEIGYLSTDEEVKIDAVEFTNITVQ